MSQMDPLMEVFLYENSQLLEQLEEMFLSGEENHYLSKDNINEVFRIMHTIKGSSSMMSFDSMAKLAHRLEDLFSSVREQEPPAQMWSSIFDIVLEAIDYFKAQMENIQEGNEVSGDTADLISRIEIIHKELKGEEPIPAASEGAASTPAAQEAPKTAAASDEKAETSDNDVVYKAVINFQDDCGMETIRAFGVVNALKGMYSDLTHIPEDVENNCDEDIADAGFTMYIKSSEVVDVLKEKLEETVLLKSLEFGVANEDEIPEKMKTVVSAAAPAETAQKASGEAEAAKPAAPAAAPAPAQHPAASNPSAGGGKGVQQSFISVNVYKIDKLMNLMGEIVTTESMVIKNPDIANMHLENFDKQARQLRKLTDELQDVVMSIRMVPISSTFHKMKRIVRDMCKKVNKEANLVLIGEKTEVDKNVLDALSDPLMHLIRNSMDHGLESPEDREKVGKDKVGTVTLEAKNTGGDIIVSVSDDGRGLDRHKLIAKAQANGLTTKSEGEISDKEAYSFILMPGFSTKEKVTEFSGRGVGMDVVRQNLESIGGSISIDSELGKGMTITMHIPLTLAIIEGMNVSVGKSKLIIPILNIKESLDARYQEIIKDPDGNDMVMIRGECFRIIKLYEEFNIYTDVTDVNDSILVLVETERGTACLMVDKLLGEQQAVIKPIPTYLTKVIGDSKGIGGCSILGDGNISLIIDVNSLINEA